MTKHESAKWLFTREIFNKMIVTVKQSCVMQSNESLNILNSEKNGSTM